METKEYVTIERAEKGWPSGPWDNEPDKMQWTDEATGLPCLIVRNPWSGALCGYVGLPPNHPLHGETYGNDYMDFDVHGGLTFSDKCSPGETEARGVCHVPAPGEPDDVWWLGFDCGHSWDYSPQDLMEDNKRGGIWRVGYNRQYRTVEYVKNECKNLAAQVVEKATSSPV